jgi:transcriptional regulator with XRE-family HTH domain
VIQIHWERAKLTQERLAELVEVSKNYIGNIERNERKVSLSCLARICKILKVKPSALMAEAGF